MATLAHSTAYRPEPRLAERLPWLGDAVAAADFPEHTPRWRNQRAAETVGLGALSDAAWLDHFGRFAPLPANQPRPLALRYHGHQFRVYNPELGDGRGFLFGQLRDDADRLLDLGTKGSGQTPWSRQGDGRLTLKGAVREILATELLEALGAETSRTFSVIETGEALWRGDEPSPTRSAVLVRLSHGHVRIGSFQRLAALGEHAQLEALTAYCLETFPGPPPPADAPGRDEPAVILLHQVVERLARLAASYMAAGFVHGVLNTDNMNVTGESFDYGPWRWLPRWDAEFTAAYFDHAGLYAFGRQPEAIHWNCVQLAVAMRPLADSAPLIAAIDRFAALYGAAHLAAFVRRLGVEPRGDEADGALAAAAERALSASGEPPDLLFFRHRGGRDPPADAFGELLRGYRASGADDHPLWRAAAPPMLPIEEVERVWAPIAASDDWRPLTAKLAEIRALGEALAMA